jgi:phage terminase large subunit GpA-like protein
VKAEQLKSEILGLWKPPPRLTLSEWADRHAVLSAESSAEAGRWKTLAYQKGVMDAFTDPKVEMVVWMKSARVGATKIFNHLVAYHMHQDPCPVMVVQPTVEDAEGYSKDEIAPMVRDTPVLRDLVSDPKAKDAGNTILAKQFPGGVLGMVGANSARGFRRVSRRVVLFDEVDGYPASTNEGDQIKLGIRRSEYYWNRKIGIASTPTVKGLSRIETWFERTDQRRYFVPCPFCDRKQYLRWPQMKWEKDRPETAAYQCEECKELIPHSKKRWMVDRGEWRATAPSESPGYVGFHLWAGYSYSPNATWEQLVREFLEVKGNPEQLRTFVNVVLGETWEENYSSKVNVEGLLERVENYERGTVPNEVLCLTAGVDVQDNRLALSIIGWRGDPDVKGRMQEEEAWLIEHTEIWGNPTQGEVWKQLDHMLEGEYPRADGKKLKVLVACVDSGGHCTSEVYNYCRTPRKGQMVVAIKGASTKGKPIIGKETKVDINLKGKLLKRGASLYLLGVDGIKDTMMGRLRFVEPGPGYLHFGAAATPEYFEQLTAERKVTRYNRNGMPVSEYVKKGNARNESWDCLCYSYAALHLLYRRFDRRTIWDQMQARIEGRKPPVTSTQKAAAPSFVSGW